MKYRTRTFLTVLLALLTLGMVVGYRSQPSTAYFTTYAVAKGSVRVDLGTTENFIEDEYAAGRKTVSIANQGDYDCFARVKVIAPDWLTLRIGGEEWQDGGDGFWYCSRVLKPGESTPVLNVDTCWLLLTDEITEQMQSCDVVVVDEFTMVRYSEDGTPEADWKWQKGSDVN